MDTTPLRAWRMPNRRTALWFWFRRMGLALIRKLHDRRSGNLQKWSCGQSLANAPIIAQQRTPLWNDGRPDEFLLIAGKIENLRVAQQAFHAVEVPAGAVWSFWRQLGRPSRRRGFVVGREIRSGCVIPTVAGGICQISNAIATCAHHAGFEFVERHSHSAKIEMPEGRTETMTPQDATVFWNYIDLRLRASAAWRIELELSASEMIVTLRSDSARVPMASEESAVGHAEVQAERSVPVARGCLTCKQYTCFLHNPKLAGDHDQRAQEAWLLNDWTPEFERYLAERKTMRPPLVLGPPRFRKKRGHEWASLATPPNTAIHQALPFTLRRLLLRLSGNEVLHARLLRENNWLAAQYAVRLQPEHVHLIIDQALLPHLWRRGVLAGRSYDVLASNVPMQELCRRLDEAAQRWPDEASLRMLRADPALQAAEHAALQAARRLITAHSDVAALLHDLAPGRVSLLDWMLPDAHHPRRARNNQCPTLVLPASGLARKGLNELALALSGLRCKLLILGTPPENQKLWGDAEVHSSSYESNWVEQADLVVLPAYVEHAPRAVLKAIAAGIDVIASPACGLGRLVGVKEVAAGDSEGLRAAIKERLQQIRHAES